MKEIALKASKRETGKQVSKKMRREGRTPGVFYMPEAEPISIAVDPKEMRDIIYTPYTRLVKLNIEGDKEYKCVMKAITFDPITDEIVHFDMLGLSEDRVFTCEIPFILTGQAEGVRLGGLMQHTLHKTKISCLPKDLPEAIEIDVTELTVGQSIHIVDIKREGVKFEVPNSTIICSVVASRLSKSDTDEDGQEESAE